MRTEPTDIDDDDLPDVWGNAPDGAPTFAEYLRSHARRTDNIRGDFIEDARGEIERGRFTPATTWHGVEWHLWSRHACHEAVVGAYDAYRRYRLWVAP